LSGTATYKINTKDVAIETAIDASFNTWDMVTNRTLFIDGGDTVKIGANLDGENTVSWAPISNQNIIAQTTMWYYPGNRPKK